MRLALPPMFGWSAMDFWSSSWRSENGAQYLTTPSDPLRKCLILLARRSNFQCWP